MKNPSVNIGAILKISTTPSPLGEPAPAVLPPFSFGEGLGNGDDIAMTLNKYFGEVGVRLSIFILGSSKNYPIPFSFRRREWDEAIKKAIFRTALLCFLTLSAKAQIPSADFKAINDAYKNTFSYSMDVHYIYYPHRDSARTTDHLSGYFKKKGNNYISDLLQVKSIQNDSFLISIDQSNDIIVVADPRKLNESWFTLGVDSALKLCSEVKFQKTGETEHGYIFDFTNEWFDFDRIEIYFNPKNYFITRLLLVFRKQEIHPVYFDPEDSDEFPKIEIRYSNLNLSPQLDDALFSVADYIRQVNGEWVGNGKYRNHEIVYQKLNQ